MTTIVLVRHGATTWSGKRYVGRADPPLSDAGRRSVEAVATWLVATLPAGIRIVTSPSRRAHETAAILAVRAAPAVLETDARWLEADFGDAEGRTFDEIDARYPELAARLAAGEVEIDWPDGETAGALHDRVARALALIVAGGRPTVVVSHAGPIRVAVALATGRSPIDVRLPDPGEVTTIEVGSPDVAGRAGRAGP